MHGHVTKTRQGETIVSFSVNFSSLFRIIYLLMNRWKSLERGPNGGVISLRNNTTSKLKTKSAHVESSSSFRYFLYCPAWFVEYWPLDVQNEVLSGSISRRRVFQNNTCCIKTVAQRGRVGNVAARASMRDVKWRQTYITQFRINSDQNRQIGKENIPHWIVAPSWWQCPGGNLTPGMYHCVQETTGIFPFSTDFISTNRNSELNYFQTRCWEYILVGTLYIRL